MSRHGLRGVLWVPRHRRRGPAVLVLGGSEGGIPPVTRKTTLAAAGYETFALAYFDAPGLPKRLCRIPIEYFGRALRWLHHASGRRVVAIGASRGSEAALLAAIDYPRYISGVIALNPSATVRPGLCATRGSGAAAPGGVAWTFKGQPVPRVTNGAVYPPFPRRDRIPAWRLRAPLLALGSGADQVWPSGIYARSLFAHASAVATRPPGALHVFPQAGHVLGCFAPACRGRTYAFGRPLGGSRRANNHAQRQTLQMILTFLARVRG